jgi:Uma2 family endonuclease
MAQPAPIQRLTEAEYLDFERKAEVKHEFFDGEVFAMAGGTPAHSLISANAIRALGNRLPGGCRVFTSDLRVKVEVTGLYTYPDISVVCGERQFSPDAGDTLVNPTLLVEVLSESSEGYDRGRKFEHYRQIPSLRGYLLIRQDYPHVEFFARGEDGLWTLSDASGHDTGIPLSPVQIELPLREVYAGVEFAAPRRQASA